MHAVLVSLDFAAPAERVFETVSAHERFLAAPGVSCRLANEGTPERDGLGAVREVKAGQMTFLEEIITFQRPVRYEYVIRELRVAGRKTELLQHEKGTVELQERGGHTSVQWRSRFEVRIPLVGRLLEPILGAVLTRNFRQLLEQARRRIEAETAPDSQAGAKSRGTAAS